MIDSAVNSAKSLLSIINDVLDVSRIESGRLQVEDVEFSVDAVCDDVMRLIAPRASEQGLELNAYIAPSIPSRLHGDPGKLRQILTNLVANAVKFTQYGEINLIVDEPEGAENKPGEEFWVEFTVLDTAIGIPLAQQESIFDMFTQTDSATGRRYGGSGLGLFICRKLSHRMGGTIDLTSEPGFGTEFHTRLPLRRIGADSVLPPALDAIKHGKVLLLTKNPGLGTTVSRYLTAWSIETLQAPSPDLAATVIDDVARGNQAILMVLVDQEMNPDLAQVTEALRTQIAGQLPPLHLISYSGIEASKLLAAGISGVLHRPISRTELVRVLGKLSQPIAETPAVTVASAGFTGHALVVDDNPLNCFIAAQMLKRVGLKVIAIESGAQALEILASNPQDIVFTDCQMPDMDGYSLAREIRRQEHSLGRQRVPIVAFTASLSKEELPQCIEAGMDDLLYKPCARDALQTSLQQWLIDAAPVLVRKKVQAR